jgi:mono/diheme cytochrome c family protein
MKRLLKILGAILGALLVVIVVLAIAVFFLSNSELNKTVEVEIASVEIPEPDDDVLARGEYLTRSVGLCVECHGPTLAGDNLIDEPIFAVVNAPNLTPGEGGTGNFTDEDFVRAIRHGVGPDGTRLLIMPSEIFVRFSEEDLGAIIAYLRSLPPQDNDLDDVSAVIARAASAKRIRLTSARDSDRLHQ